MLPLRAKESYQFIKEGKKMKPEIVKIYRKDKFLTNCEGKRY
jgi:hypothetical protein